MKLINMDAMISYRHLVEDISRLRDTLVDMSDEQLAHNVRKHEMNYCERKGIPEDVMFIIELYWEEQRRRKVIRDAKAKS